MCKAGYTPSGNSAGTCEACALKHYKPATGAGTCIPCGAGKTTAEIGSTAETQCGKHRYREVTTNLNELTKPLSDLPSYFFFILVVGTCTAGQYGTTSTCEPCGIGTYQPSTGQGKCITCPNGSTTTTTGQSAVSGCSG